MPSNDLTIKAMGEANLLTIDPNGGTMIKKYSSDRGREITTSAF
jgi:hypothetical protein